MHKGGAIWGLDGIANSHRGQAATLYHIALMIRIRPSALIRETVATDEAPDLSLTICWYTGAPHNLVK